LKKNQRKCLELAGNQASLPTMHWTADGGMTASICRVSGIFSQRIAGMGDPANGDPSILNLDSESEQ
jgi:hypothetical protein